jgi:hypothetical protein
MSSLIYSWLLLLLLGCLVVAGDSEHLQGKHSEGLSSILLYLSRLEMRFKFWLQPGMEECYHQLLENGTSIYFMYEILNAHAHDSTIVAYFRNAYNGSIVAMSTTPQRGHMEIIANDTCESLLR